MGKPLIGRELRFGTRPLVHWVGERAQQLVPSSSFVLGESRPDRPPALALKLASLVSSSRSLVVLSCCLYTGAQGV